MNFQLTNVLKEYASLRLFVRIFHYDACDMLFPEKETVRIENKIKPLPRAKMKAAKTYFYIQK